MEKSSVVPADKPTEGSSSDDQGQTHVLVPIKLLTEMQSQLDSLNRAMYMLSISAVAIKAEAKGPAPVEVRPEIVLEKQCKVAGYPDLELEPKKVIAQAQKQMTRW